MLWLYILIGIILFLLLILLIPVGVRACYNEGFIAELKIGFVTIKLYPPKPKKPKKEKKKKKKEPKKEILTAHDAAACRTEDVRRIIQKRNAPEKEQV